VKIITYNISIGNKNPAIGTITIYSYMHIYSQAWRHWSPSIVTAGTPPNNPGRAPFISWHPIPAIKIVPIPPTVMKWSPTPIKIRNPGPSETAVYPMSIGKIRNKVGTSIGNPNISIIGVQGPKTIGT
jgi:hypothetical protein